MPKTYKALAEGYVDSIRVHVGDVFTTSAPKGSWMEEVKEDKPAPKKADKSTDD